MRYHPKIMPPRSGHLSGHRHSGNRSGPAPLRQDNRSPPYPGPPKLHLFPTDTPTTTSCCLPPRASSSSPPALFHPDRSNPPGSEDFVGIPLSSIHRHHMECATRTGPGKSAPVHLEKPANRPSLPATTDHGNISA